MGLGLYRVVGVAGCAVLALGSFNVAPGAADSQVAGDTTGVLAAKPAPKRVKAISAGFEHSLALLEDTTVVGWGTNKKGQVGNGTTSAAYVPKAVCAVGVESCPPGAPASSFLRGVTAISSGAFFSLAVVDGGVVAWGRAAEGSQGSLGIGKTRGNACGGECQTVPAAVCAIGVESCPPGSPPSSFLQGVKAVAAGSFFALALLDDDTMVAWGSNGSGQLGNAGVKTYAAAPVPVCAVNTRSCVPGSKATSFLHGITAISAGDKFSMALQNHTVLAWGHNRYGELGNGTLTGPNNCNGFGCGMTPVPVIKLEQPVSAISAGNYHAVAIVTDAHGVPVGVMAWGSNTRGQVGLGPALGNTCDGVCQTKPVPVPRPVQGNWKGLTKISAGRAFSLAIVGGGVVAWGDNSNPGRLGDGTHKSNHTPRAVCAIAVKSCPPGSPAKKFLRGVTAASAGGTVSLALLVGAVAVWGSDFNGSLGTGGTHPNGVAYPVGVTGLGGRAR